MTPRHEETIWLRALARSVTIVLLAVAVIVTGLPGVGEVRAQERPRSILDMLFGGPAVRQPQRAEPPPRRIRREPAPRRQKSTSTRKSGKTKARTTASAPAAAPAVVAKSETARSVLVVGDFLAGTLAAGLEKALAKRPDLKVIDASKGSSGLVRADHYDWPGSLPSLIDKEKPAMVVVMLGSNDRQPIESGSMTLAVRSPEWAASYEQRALALASAVGSKEVPLLWVGMPAFRLNNMTADMAFLNEVYRKAATSVSGEFVDIWDGFVDADGAFSYSGPDIAGQQARLRNEDGITMTDAGRDKLAFFAENPVQRILGTDGSAPAVSEAPSRPVAVANPATATSAPLLALTDPSLDGGDVLLGGVPTADRATVASPRDRLVTAGLPGAKTPGRADDFAWNPKSPAVAPIKTADPVLFRGSVDLGSVMGPKPLVPLSPMPTLADAIIEDWAKGKDSAPSAQPDAVPEAGPREPTVAGAASAVAPAITQPTAPAAPAGGPAR
ncbi:hypothetical protein Sa4125_10370 [Aureimonas sp. SA4125]|uniref:SGNH/GDSL hydrolase family protein n=1 Tax=Aureimonas sp. SA4125 TaxID=2826993 RepID=UPI001CC5152E|nr:SGNH family hydrolase [Aureimonas sp. SA4125]BDA83495.1 hypothetical protein Sa4125_10370 [Aureimonas sp. SA4125]